MRFVTYIGLVVRRVWAKKGILFGSLLGATLVIALLVVVPLYEASVQAVDLKFSIDNALENETSVTAFSIHNDYTPGTGEVNRVVVDDARQTWLQPWYPTNVERSQTRELLVIPSGGDAPNDFIELGEQWKQDTALFLEEGGDLAEVRSPPYPRPSQEATQVRIFTSPDLESKLTIVDGVYDATTTIPLNTYEPFPLMIGRDVARLTRSEVGDRFFIKPFSGLPSTFEYVEVAAIVEPVDSNDSIWGIDNPLKMVYLDQLSFDRWLKTTSTTPEIDPWDRDTRGLPDLTVTQRWNMPLDRSTVQLEDLEEFQSRLAQFRAEVARESGGEIATASVITVLLDAFTTRSVVFGGPILAMLALVVGGAIYFLVYTSAMTVEREGAEFALLKSRGASTWQTVGIHLGQSVVVAVIAASLAPFVARFLVGMTGRVPPLSTLTGGDPLEVAQVRSVVPFVLAGGLIAFVAMGVAVFPYARRGILALRALATRPGTRSVWQKYNIDLFAIALSLVLLAQLRLRGFIDRSTGEARLDPLAIIFPALLLFAGALVLLRVFPYILRLVGWALTKPRNLSTALTGWHLGRNPVPYGRLALLVWVTTGLGAFALTYAATLEASYTDRAEFAAGADVRVVGGGAGYAVAPEGSFGTPVLRTLGAPRRSGRSAEVLAVIPEGFSEVVTWRPDYGAETPQEVFMQLRPDGVAPDVGIEIPQSASALRVEGIVVPLSLLAEAEAQSIPDRNHRLLMRVVDGRYRMWTMVADDDFIDSGWRTVTVDLSTGISKNYTSPPEPPFTIVSMWVERSDQTSGSIVDGAVLLFTSLNAVTPDGDVPLSTEELNGTDGLEILRGVPASSAAEERYSSVPPDIERPTQSEIEASSLWRAGTAEQWSLPGNRTRSTTKVPQARRDPPDIKVLLDHEAAAIAGLNIGDVSSYNIGSQAVTGEVAGFVNKVPTATDSRRQGVMVIDLAAYNVWANGTANWSLVGGPASVESPDELWVSTDHPDATVRVVSSQMTFLPDNVWTIGLVEAAFASRPVQVGLVAILFVGAATGVVLALAGVTGYVLLAVSRRAREMGVLRALGFKRSSVGFTFALEQLVVIGLGAAIGVLGGVGLVVVMLPFLQLGETDEIVDPSILINIPSAQLLGYIAVVGVLLIVSVLWATRRVSTRRMSEVLREVER
ncbi:MAG: FtsX-like permease family protein [Acidimicrobiia bacterium]